MFLIILLYAISASTFLISKNLLLFCSPIFLTGLRTILAGSILLIYLILKKQKILLKKTFRDFAQIAFFSFFISNSFKFWSLNSITAQKASAISTLEPIFAAIISYFLFQEKLSFKKLICLITCVSCAFLMTNGFSILNFGLNVPEMILIISIISSAYGALLIRKIILKHNYNIYLVNGLTMFYGGLLALSSSFLFETKEMAEINADNFYYFGFLLFIMILVSNLFAYNLYSKLLKNYSVVLISCASFLRPSFVKLYNYVLFGEQISSQQVIATFIIFIGLYLFYKEEMKISCIENHGCN